MAAPGAVTPVSPSAKTAAGRPHFSCSSAISPASARSMPSSSGRPTGNRNCELVIKNTVAGNCWPVNRHKHQAASVTHVRWISKSTAKDVNSPKPKIRNAQ